MVHLFEGIEGVGDSDDIGEIYEKLERNCPNPSTTSKRLWKLRRACGVNDGDARRLETFLEKAVANLAHHGHMPNWYNQCPTASGIGDFSRDRRRGSGKDTRRNIDLVHWNKTGGRARLIELKVASNNPLYALRQVLKHGAVYAFCRVHKQRLPLHCRLHLGMMKARHVSLEVVAPRRFYERHDEEAARIARMQEHLDEFCCSRMDGVSMSMSALAFPGSLPKVENTEDIKALFDGDDLTDAGKRVCKAFRGLVPVWPAP